MDGFSGMGKTLMMMGVLLIIAGLVLYFFHRIPFLGKLPGDIYIKRENFSFYFPLATSIMVSIIISLIMYLFRK